MIEHIRTYTGYCGQCGEARIIAEFRLKGWGYVFTICMDCTNKIQDRLKANGGAAS